MRPTLLLPLALLAAADAPAWRLHLPLTAVPGAAIQRVELPARAILALARGDGGDVRVLDADGRSQPLARLPAPPPPARRVSLTPLPILGAADALTVTGVTLKVDGDQARVVRLDGKPAGAGGGQEMLGVLLDTRRVDGPVRALALDVVAPAHQPITFTLASSDDLQDWRDESERVLFRAGGPTPVVLPLDSEDLHGRMLRVTWRAQGRLLSAVTIAGATLIQPGSADSVRVAVPATLPPLLDAHHVEFAMPTTIAPAAIRLTPAAGDPPTPVRLFGRADREQPWALAGSGVSARGARPIEIAQPYREWRIEAPSGDGFARSPAAELRFAPYPLAFIAGGRPPYALAAGRAEAAPSFVPAATLTDMAGSASGPILTASLPDTAPPSLALPALDDAPSSTTYLLWGVLLLGVAGLSAMAWVLSRSPRPTGGDTIGT